MPLEFGKLVQEQDPVMGQADLSRPGNGPAADETGVGDRVVRGPKRPGGDRPGVEK